MVALYIITSLWGRRFTHVRGMCRHTKERAEGIWKCGVRAQLELTGKPVHACSIRVEVVVRIAVVWRRREIAIGVT